MGVNYSEVIERMRWAGKLKNDSAVARVVGVTPQALSSCKKRGEMPSDLVLKFAGIFNLSLDWLITGEGEMYAGRRHGTEGFAEDAGSHRMAFGPEKTDMAVLSAVEMEYVRRLIQILRGKNESDSTAIKSAIDAFLDSSEAKAAVNER